MPWVYSGVTILVGLFLYWLSRRFRVIFGLIEIVVALGMMWLRFFPHGASAYLITAPPSFLEGLANATVAWVVIVYVFVRGWDNVVSGCPWLQHRRWLQHLIGGTL